MKKKILVLLVLGLTCVALQPAKAAEWQWCVQMPDNVSPETNASAEAFLWIPPECEFLRAVVIGTHNMDEEPLFENPFFRQCMEELSVAIIWVIPGWSQSWDVNSGCQEYFEKMLGDLADVSGYGELKTVPVVPLGHSAMATYPWNFAAWNSERTLAVVSYHGDAPRTNLTGYGRENLEWGRTRNIDGIPGLMIEGEFEWWEARVNPALAFRMMYPNSCISFLCDAGRGHFDITDRTAKYIGLFIKKALEYRTEPCSDNSDIVELKKLDPHDGWLAQRWSDKAERPTAAPYSSYNGDPHDAFWYFDEEMAKLTEDIYREQIGKKPHYIGYMQNGEMLHYNAEGHIKIEARFTPERDGLTFHLCAVHTDSLRAELSREHPWGEPSIERICGPVMKVNDSTFTVRFYRVGMDNLRRSNEICLYAIQEGDEEYKASVQEIGLHIPFRNTDGKPQNINFPDIPNVTTDIETLDLNATSDSGLPVYYYVKYGPAEMEGNRLIFTKIPPRGKHPVEVSVVAWQYGIQGEFQTAQPVEQKFLML